MKKKEPVAHIMTKSVICVQKTESLRDVKKAFAGAHIRHIPVVEGEKLSGIISKSDLMRLSFGSLFDNQENADEAVLDMLNIDQVMSHKPKVVSSDTPIKDVAEIFVSEDFHALPVVDNEKIVGIVTSTDVIKYMLEQY